MRVVAHYRYDQALYAPSVESAMAEYVVTKIFAKPMYLRERGVPFGELGRAGSGRNSRPTRGRGFCPARCGRQSYGWGCRSCAYLLSLINCALTRLEKSGIARQARQDVVKRFCGLRLGPRILRTETAAVAALSAFNSLWEDLR